ncbi:arginase family protein [Candidatus Woesearchaeota archaeon]|nr:arginase family protein [Candidatus Woesearchaeota archaeon]
MNIISVPISGVSLSFEYKAIFTEIIKQYSLLGANEDGRNDVAEIREVDDANEIKDYVKDHTVFLFGDESFTAQAFRTFAAKYPNAGLLRFDSNFSSLLQLVRNSTQISTSPIIKPNQIIFAATRAWNREEADYIRTQKINHFGMKKLFELGIDEATDTLMETARNYSALYISIDISCLDPAFVTSEKKEPGGLTTRELLYMQQRLKLLKNLKIVDIVGFTPERDMATAKIAAKIMKELS